MENYYFINEETGAIIESGPFLRVGADRLCQELAVECEAAVWVIKGEHAGIVYKPDQMTLSQYRKKHGTIKGYKEAEG